MNLAIWWNLALGLVNEAADGSSKLKFATGQANSLDNRSTIYSLLQCSPDLSPSDCRNCLYEAIDDYDKCCRGRQGGGVNKPSCIMRWDLYPFFCDERQSAVVFSATSIAGCWRKYPERKKQQIYRDNHSHCRSYRSFYGTSLSHLFPSRKGKKTYEVVKGKS
ncbi:hypothetical protein NL676_018075, partial [Syzygium grande]